jgi:gliding-associated putative ABC transporter substrate-binding component GldG
MARIWALYKKELRTYFNSPIAYLVLTALLIGVGYFFFQTFFAGGQATMRFFFRVAAWSFLLFGPAITMKLIAEEKKTGTIEPLLALPLDEWELVFGKFFAAWTLLAVYLLITLVYPILIAFLGDLDGGPIIGGYLGLFFLGGTFVALGTFASSISRNQVISLIVAFAIALLLFLLDLLLPFLPMRWQNVVEFIGIDAHFKNISRGVIDSRDAIYSLSLMAFFLFLAVQGLQGRLTDHSKKWRLNRVLFIGAAAGCLISLNAVSFLAHGRIDLTEDRQFTLSDASRDLLRELSEPLTVTAYFSKDIPPPANNTANVVRDLLDEYRAASDGRMTFAFVDPDAPAKDGKPDQALIAQVQKDGVPKVDMRAISKDREQIVKVFMGLVIQYGENTEAIPVVQSLANLEYEITSRVAKLMRDKTPTVAVLAGHGEFTTAQGLTNMTRLLGDKFAVKDVDLSQDAAALSEADALVVAGPKKPLKESELLAIDQYIMRGGRAVFLVDRLEVDLRSGIGRPLTTGLEELVAVYGVKIGPSLVLDLNAERVAMARQAGGLMLQSLVSFPAVIRVQDLAKGSSLTRNLSGLSLAFAAPLEVAPVEGIKADVVARSSPKTWLFEVKDSFLADPQALPPPQTEDEFVGAQNLVVTLSGSFASYFKNRTLPVDEGGASAADSLVAASPETRLAVVGSSALVGDQMTNRLNLTFFANLVDWLVQDERLMTIRTRSIENRPLETLGDAQRAAFKYGNMLGPSLLLVLFGLVRWRQRVTRKRVALSSVVAAGRED